MDEICPQLGATGGDNRRQPPVEFPSFENQCFALGDGELILLGDQATYCLGRAHRTCPRWRRAQSDPFDEPAATAFVPFHTAAEETWTAAYTGSGDLNTGFEPLLGNDAHNDEPGRRRWAWFGAVLVFASVFLCGGMVATYTGWQWIARNLPARASSGSIDTAANANVGPTPAVYLVFTATPQADAQPPLGPTAPLVVLPPGEPAAPEFPLAVTPTPLVVAPPLAGAVAGVGDANGAGDAGSGASPPMNVDLPIPTRRPTPIFDLPTSTPLALVAPTASPTVTPLPLGTPIILFAPEKPELMEGECTLVRWNVKNVREVYYENLPMSGQGEREECIERKSQVYTLLVVLGDGASQIYTTTVTYLAPTPTPTVTPSFTPEPVFTPTWTPIPPTATTAPVVNYGVVLAANDSATLTCAAGQNCDAGLLVTNSGDSADTLVVSVVQGGAFPAQVCRPDGVCAANDLSISNVGPGNTAYVMLRITVPGDAAPAQQTSYGLVASSRGSGGAVRSARVDITVSTP